MFNWKVWDAPWGSRYNEVALAIFSSYEPDESGFITLTADYKVADPTTVEGFVGMLGSTNVYDKEKTYQHILTDYGLSFTETNTFVEGVGSGGWEHPEIPSTPGYPAKTAYVISTRGYDSQYEHMRLPAITDFAQLIEDSFPFKFWARLIRGNARTHIWDSLVEAFRTTDITDGYFANHLFCRASGKKIDYIDDLYLNFNLPSVDPQTGEPIDSYIDLMGIFDGATNARCDLFKNIHFNIKSGVLKSMVNAFRYSDINSVTFNRLVNVTDWSGSFEGTTMTGFPENIAPGHQWNGTYSEITTDMHYAADGSRLQWFGNYKDPDAVTDENKYYTAVVIPAVYGLVSRSNIQEIRYIMDFKFVIPKAWCVNDDTYGNAVFNASNLTTAKIKNINKGDWSLDGVARQNQYGSICCGDISNFDADSVNYMLFNIFDLKRNDQATGDTERFENELNSFNGWTLSSGTKRPVVFETWPNATSTFSRTVTTAGIMKVKVGLTNCTLTMTNGGNTVTVNGGDQTLNIATGDCTFTFTKTGNNAKGSLELDSDFHFLSELTPGLTNCSIYLPASLKTKASSLAIQTAQERGWNVYFGGELEPVVTLEPCTFQFELNGASYADNNSNQEIRFYDNSGYDDSFGMVTPGSSVGSVNTSFETVSIPANTQNTNVYVTKSSTPFIVTIADDEASKEMQATYRFSGERNGQTVKVTAHFKNLTDTSAVDKEIEYTEGDGYAAILELDDWFVSGGTVRVQVSFRLEAN